jgi:hypothetical protein
VSNPSLKGGFENLYHPPSDMARKTLATSLLTVSIPNGSVPLQDSSERLITMNPAKSTGAIPLVDEDEFHFFPIMIYNDNTPEMLKLHNRKGYS